MLRTSKSQDLRRAGASGGDSTGGGNAFIVNAWYVCAQSEEVTRSPFGRTVCGIPVVFWRKENGAVVAMEDRCCHRRMPLRKGILIGDRLQCFYHGFEFEADGSCVHIPGQSAIPKNARVRAFPVVERHNWIWIWMGAPELADKAKIVPYPWRDAKGWGDKGTYFHVRCDYRLIIDNLLDLTHVGFVHRSTIGNQAVAEKADNRVFTDEGKVTVARWIIDQPPPPTYQKAAGWSADDKVDRWQIIEFRPPGFIRLFTGAARNAVGGRDFGFRDLESATPPGGIGMRNLNAITPETQHSCHYFWSQAQEIQPESPAFTDALFQQIRVAFQQDWEVFELQQENWDDRSVVSTKNDVASIEARRMIDRLLASEACAHAEQAAR
jgi:phenylpropionate dioxygenase-like ring-hydroxylating dioxygenase large terminal subunit